MLFMCVNAVVVLCKMCGMKNVDVKEFYNKTVVLVVYLLCVLCFIVPAFGFAKFVVENKKCA